LLGHLDRVCARVDTAWKNPTPASANSVRIVPLWHGTSLNALSSISSNGFAALQETDSGYFGKGLYFSESFEYAARVYGNKSQLVMLCLVCVGNVFPVIRTDMEKLMGGANYKNYDTHFVPVVPQNEGNVNEVVYLPCATSEQTPKYYEFVVFNSAQVLPQYVVSLSPKLVESPSLSPNVSSPTPMGLPADAVKWTVNDVCNWFTKLSLTNSYATMLTQNGVDGDILVNELKTSEDLKQIGITSFGDIRKILRAKEPDK